MTAIDLTEYFTEANLRSLVIGTGAGALAAGVLALLRRSPGWSVGVMAPLVALFASDRLEWPDPADEWIMAVALVSLLAGRGYERIRSEGPAAPALLLACAGGVWLAVPENDPSLIVAGSVVGVALVGRATDPGAGWGLVTAVAWSVVLGARTTGWSFVGGLLCLAPLVAVGTRELVPRARGRLPAWPWLVVSGGAVSFVAARWIAVAPEASWFRVGVVAVGAVTGAVVWRP